MGATYSINKFNHNLVITKAFQKDFTVPDGFLIDPAGVVMTSLCLARNSKIVCEFVTITPGNIVGDNAVPKEDKSIKFAGS
eukprot:m.129561 g.129561  ORF g.129561 m.129561 type:complete len:81 (-) comp14579_c1_seq2:2185-2427(-)